MQTQQHRDVVARAIPLSPFYFPEVGGWIRLIASAAALRCRNLSHYSREKFPIVIGKICGAGTS
jgi:hypothetical protein